MPHDTIRTAEHDARLRNDIDHACHDGTNVAIDPRCLECMLDELSTRRSAGAALTRAAQNTLAGFPPGDPDGECGCGFTVGQNPDCEVCEMIREIVALRRALRDIIVMARNNGRRD